MNFGSEPSSADLVVNGISAFELMGSWDYSTIQSDGSTATGTAPANGPGAAFVAAGKLGYTAFPSVPGGKGNLADLAGNTENYYSVLAKTRYPDAVADFLKVMYSPGFVKKELALGNLTTTKNTPSLISGATAPYLKWQYQLVNKAPPSSCRGIRPIRRRTRTRSTLRWRTTSTTSTSRSSSSAMQRLAACVVVSRFGSRTT